MIRSTIPFAALVAALAVASVKAASTAASRADDFVASAGVVTHWSFPDYISNQALLLQKVGALGVRYVRDGDDTWSLSAARTLWSTYGVKTLFLTGRRKAGNWPQMLDQTQIAQEVTDIAAMPAGVIAAIEGPNEYDISHPSSDPSWSATLKTYCQSVHDKVKSNATISSASLVGPSLTSVSAYTTMGNLDAMIDYACLHAYMANYNPGSTGWGVNGYGSIAYNLTYCAYVQSPSHKPIWSTECGYRLIGTQRVDEVTHTKYAVRMFGEYFRCGLKACIYELTNQDAEDFGLLDANHAERPAFGAVKNLLNLLKDPGAAFTPGSLNYALAGDTLNVRKVLLQKRNGVFYLMLWHEVQSWEPSKLVQDVVPKVNVTLSVISPVTILSDSIYEIQDNGSMTAVTQAISAGKLTLSVPDRMMVVRLSTNNSTKAGGQVHAAIATHNAAVVQKTIVVNGTPLQAPGGAAMSVYTLQGRLIWQTVRQPGAAGKNFTLPAQLQHKALVVKYE